MFGGQTEVEPPEGRTTEMMQQERYVNALTFEQYEIDTLGAPFRVTLLDSVTVGIDLETGKEMVRVPDLAGLLNAVVRRRVSHPRKLNGDELKFIRNALGVRANPLAQFLEMSPEHLSRCEAGGIAMSAISERFFRLFTYLGTFFHDPEGLLAAKELDAGVIEEKAKKPNESFVKFAVQFLSMKIEAAFDPEKELHFTFAWNGTKQSDDDTEWEVRSSAC
jgi:DNA-binding transcriptional regulator YiaG